MPIPIDVGLAVAMIVLAAGPAVRGAAWLARRRSLSGRAALGDPVAAIDRAYHLQVAALQDVRRGVAVVVTADKRLELQAAGLAESQLRLQAEARAALVGGREDLARLALTRAELTRGQRERLEAQREELRGEAVRLQVTAERLRARVEGVRTQRDALRAQEAAARARVRIGESLTGLGPGHDDLPALLEQARVRTRALQARALALGDLAPRPPRPEAPPPAPPVTADDDASLDRRLAALAGELLGPGGVSAPTPGPAGAVPPPRPPTEDR